LAIAQTSKWVGIADYKLNLKARLITHVQGALGPV
jgi:hypothetical protein